MRPGRTLIIGTIAGLALVAPGSAGAAAARACSPSKAFYLASAQYQLALSVFAGQTADSLSNGTAVSGLPGRATALASATATFASQAADALGQPPTCKARAGARAR